MPTLVTTKFKIHNAEQFVEALSETSATNLYLFIGSVKPWEDENNPPNPTDAIANTNYDYWNKMIAGKKITPADVKHVIPRINWESQTSYTAYTHKNGELYSNNFYVMTDDFNVYKCLQNNLSNGVSSIKPTGTGTNVIELGDGYKWKFMYQVSPQDTLKFVTSDYIPVQTIGLATSTSLQSSVEEFAVDGSIDIINRTSNGHFRVELTSNPTNENGDSQDFISGEQLRGLTSNSYGNLISFSSGSNVFTYDISSGNSKFTNGEVVIGVSSNARATISQTPISTYKFDEGILTNVTNTTVIQLATSANNTVDDLYVGSTIFITNNAGQGEQSKITGYDAALRRVTVETAFTIEPGTSSGYEIAPTITLFGDGRNFKARTKGNSSHGMTDILVTQKGSDYSIATIDISANSSHGSGANGEIIIGPNGGHGKNAIEELGGNRVMISARLSGNESGYITTANDFRQVGLLRDPLINDPTNTAFFTSSLADQSVKLSVSGVTGQFRSDESLFQGEKIYQGDSLINSTANGVLIDFLNNNTLRLNEVFGDFQESITVRGAESGATAIISSNGINRSDMKPYSGDILYVENRTKIQRLDDQVEDFKIVLEF